MLMGFVYWATRESTASSGSGDLWEVWATLKIPVARATWDYERVINFLFLSNFSNIVIQKDMKYIIFCSFFFQIMIAYGR